MTDHRIPESTLNEIIEMGQAGMPAKGVSEEVGVSMPTVLSIFREYGVTVGPAARPTLEERMDEADVDDMIARYTETDEAVIDIISDFGLTYQQLYAILTRRGISRRTYDKGQLEGRKAQMDAAVGMYIDGVSLYQIKEDTGVHQPQLHAELHRRNIPLRRPRRKG